MTTRNCAGNCGRYFYEGEPVDYTDAKAKGWVLTMNDWTRADAWCRECAAKRTVTTSDGKTVVRGTESRGVLFMNGMKVSESTKVRRSGGATVVTFGGNGMEMVFWTT